MDRRSRLAGSFVFALVLAVGVAHLAAAFVVRRHVLQADTYTTALDDADVFHRIYTEVLADPELTDTVADLLGGLEVDPALASDVAATTTNALRWALPPERVRDGTDVVVTGLVDFLRGDVDELRVTVPLADLLDRVDDAAVTLTRTLLHRATTVSIDSLDAYRAEVDGFVATLAAGRVPSAVPVLAGAEFDPAQVVDAILDATGGGADPEVRSQVAASLASGDAVEALTMVAAESVRPHVEREVAALIADQGGRFDVVGEVTDRARTRADSAQVTLNSVRGTLGWFDRGPQLASVVLVAAGLMGLVLFNRGQPRRLAVFLGAAAAAVAVLFLGVARLVASHLVDPIEAGARDGAGSWNLPGGLRAVIGDVGIALGEDLRREVIGVAGAFLLLALAAGAAVLTITYAHRLRSAAGSARSFTSGGPTFAAGAACVALLVGAGVLTATSVEAGTAEPCNGHAELCDRRYDEVAYAATHNAMSSPDVVRVWPEQDGDLTAQLDAGVRALLIDTHYWRRIDSAADLVASVDDTSIPVSLPVAQAVLDAAGSLAEGRPGTFLCHNECVFGGMGFVDGLVEIRQFLEANPREVVTLIVQDDVEVADTVAAFQEAGLDDLVYDQSDPWPTLGELISRNRRLVVFAEFYGGDPPWYRDAWEAMQDTPYGFSSVDEFSCDPNRGEEAASLFLMNHWVSRLTPSRQDAVLANTREVLVDRARRCEGERGRMVNFLAVDFFNIGDVVGAADELNGVS